MIAKIVGTGRFTSDLEPCFITDRKPGSCMFWTHLSSQVKIVEQKISRRRRPISAVLEIALLTDSYYRIIILILSRKLLKLRCCMIFIWSHIYYSHITNSVTFVLDIMLGAVKTRDMSQYSTCTQDAYISKTKEQIQPPKGTRFFFFFKVYGKFRKP